MPLHPLSLVIPSCAPVGLGLPLSIRTTALPELTETQQDVSIQLVGRGGKAPRTWGLDGTSDPLPDTLSLDANTGVISGNVDAAMAASYDLVFELTDSDDPAVVVTKALTLVVNAAPSITTASLDGGTENTAYSDTLAATGGTGTLVWTVDAGTTDELPDGLSLSSAGVISGTPSEGSVGSYMVTFRVTDANGVFDTLELELAIANDVEPLVITTGGNLGSHDWGRVVSGLSIATTGGTGSVTFAVTSGTLPAGLSLNTSTGAITGVPSTWTDTTSASVFTVTATDSADPADTDAVEFTLTVQKPSFFANLLCGVRADDYDSGTGVLTCFNNASYDFEQSDPTFRPASGSDSDGPYMDFGGDDFLTGNAALEAALSVGIDNMSVFSIVSDTVDAQGYVWSTWATTNGNGLSILTTGDATGSVNCLERRNTTTTSGPLIAAAAPAFVAFGATSTRNTSNGLVLYAGSSSSAIAGSTPDEAFGAPRAGRVRLGQVASAGGYFNGHLRAHFVFTAALTAGQVQDLFEYLENNEFWGAATKTLWTTP